MSTIHVEALSADETVDLFERVTPNNTTEVIEAVSPHVPGLTDCTVHMVPALQWSAPVSGVRAVMLLGAARDVTYSDGGTSELTPGDLLLPEPGVSVTVAASEDDQDDTVLLVMN